MELKERNAAIVALFDEGKTLEETGAQFGITRERVRQIIKKADRIPRRVTIAEEIRVRNEKKAAWRAERIMQRESDLKPYLDKVRAGASFLQAAGGNPSLANRINIWAKRKGIKSSARSKWNDFSKRHEIVAAMAAAGEAWPEIADEVNKAECNLRPVGHASIYMWAYNHGYVRTCIPKPKKPSKPRKTMPEIPAFCANHAWSKDMKEAALKWREEGLSATFVADRMNREFGVSVTRNAVIGAWKRMRGAR